MPRQPWRGVFVFTAFLQNLWLGPGGFPQVAFEDQADKQGGRRRPGVEFRRPQIPRPEVGELALDTGFFNGNGYVIGCFNGVVFTRKLV
jgi:hypothetical protein